MKFDELLLNNSTRKNLELFAKSPVGALILSGENGVGLGTVAKILAKKIAKNDVFLLEPSLHKNQKTRTINTEDSRVVADLAKSVRETPLVIVIDEAEKMSENAWQPLLKIIEEPSRNLFFIFTSHELSRIPATILSRAQKIDVLPTAVSDDFFAKFSPTKLSAQKLVQVKFIAANLPAEAARLLTNEEYFRGKSAELSAARDFLAGETSRKMEIIANISSRDEALVFAKNIAKFLSRNPGRNFAKNIALVSATTENLAANANVKIQLLALALNLK